METMFVAELARALSAEGLEASSEGKWLTVLGCRVVASAGRRRHTIMFLGVPFKRGTRGFDMTEAVRLLVQSLPALLKRKREQAAKDLLNKELMEMTGKFSYTGHHRLSSSVSAFVRDDGIQVTFQTRDPEVAKALVARLLSRERTEEGELREAAFGGDVAAQFALLDLYEERGDVAGKAALEERMRRL